MNTTLENIKSRLSTKAWTPGKKDIADIFSQWRSLSDDEREDLSKRLARLDAPSVMKSSELFASLDPRSRGDLARPILKSFFATLTQLTLVDPIEFPRSMFLDTEARVRKSIAQAIGSSWGLLDLSKLRRYRDDMVVMLMSQLISAEEASEVKAVIEALGKSGDPRALKAIESYASKSAIPASVNTKKSMMTLSRDVARGDSKDDQCLPERMKGKGLVVWFTPGLEQIARGRAPFYGSEVIAESVLKPAQIAWDSLKHNDLWRAAGIIIGTVSDSIERKCFLEHLANLLKQSSAEIIGATSVTSGGPVRLRIGRSEGFSRSEIWSFAEALSNLNCGLLNDGRDAHWEIAIVQREVVLIPLKWGDDRFSWRDMSVDGASDPTIAAALVQLADIKDYETVWDPFCGAGTELVLVGKMSKNVRLLGSDNNAAACTAAKKSLLESGVVADVVLEDSLKFQRGQVDVVITNPPFGMRTVRGGARDLLEDFLGNIHKHLKPNARISLLSHAPRSTIQWAELGKLRLKRSFSVHLGGMRCELQLFEYCNYSACLRGNENHQ